MTNSCARRTGYLTIFVALLAALFARPARADAPTIISEPQSQSISAGDATSLTVVATGTSPLSYEWRFNDMVVEGATNATLTFTNAQIFQTGVYRVIVTNPAGAVTSSAATLTVSLSQNFLWARRAGSTRGYEQAKGVATDAEGNVYVTGLFSGIAAFGTNTLIPAGGSDMFLAKYTTDGKLVWVRQVGGIYDDGGSGVAVDSVGDVYVTGWFKTDVFFDSILVMNFTQSFNYDIFIAKYDSAGNVLWANNAGGGGDDDFAYSIALHTNADPIITGYFRGTGFFGQQSFGGYGHEEYFAAQYSRSSGGVVWATFGSSRGSCGSAGGWDSGLAIAVDGAGRRYIGGGFSGTDFNFFNGTIINSSWCGAYQSFVARYSSSGGMDWVQAQTNMPFIWDMTAAGTNGFYACGNNFVVARIDAAGKTLWSTGAGGNTVNATARCVTTDRFGNLLLAGGFNGTNLTFPGITFTNGVTTNLCVIASYNTNGTFRWARQFGGRGLAYDIAVDSADGVYVAGDFEGTATFGSNTLTSAGGRDIFIAKLGVLPPVILELPTSQTGFTGRSNTFSVLATGEGPLQYQWRFNGTNLPGATNSSLLVADVQLTNAGQYSVVVSNAFGVTTTPAAVLTVITGAPVILVQPQSKTVLGGRTNGFFVIATNSLPLFYQWKLNGTNLVGATESSLSITNIQASHRGDYRVEITNAYGRVLSDVVTLTVNVPATIIIQPTNRVAPVGTNVTFVVEAIGDGDLIYQWRFNGLPIGGATNSSLILTNVQLGDQGNYAVVVSNVFGMATSISASLVVQAPPNITTQPQSRTLPAGTNASLEVTVSGSPTLRYQWRHGDADLPGKTQRTLTLTNIQSGQVGEYSVVVTNAFGSVTSAPAMLSVLASAPVILVQPRNFATNAAMESATAFTVSAAGSEPLAYQWQFQGTNLPGATTAALTITNIQFGHAGEYRVVVTNVYGTVTSATAVLTVNAGFLWARSFGGTNDDRATVVAADTVGNVLAAGYFSGTAAFNTTNLVSAGDRDMALAKYDSGGNLVWVQQAGGSGVDQATALAVDRAGNSLVAGTFNGPVNFGLTNLTSNGGNNSFLAKYDHAGALLWIRQIISSNSHWAKGVAVDVVGNCWIAGSFSANLDFGTTNLPGGSGLNTFLAKYDSDGNCLWAASSGGVLNKEANSVCVDSAGNAFITGYFNNSVTFGSFNLAAIGSGPYIFVVKYDAAGNVMWAQKAAASEYGNSPGIGNGAAADRDGGVYVTGQFVGTIPFGQELIAAVAGQTNCFLARYNALGEVLWARAAGDASTTVGTAVAVDDAGNAYVTGNYATNSRFGSVVLTGTNDCFVAMFDGAGTAQWARNAGGRGFDSGQSISLDLAGGVIVAGQFQTNITFGAFLSLTNVGSFDGFVSRIAAFPPDALPLITTQPQSQAALLGSNFTLRIGALASLPGFQWRLNGVDISGATNTTLQVANFRYPDAGDYSVVVTNPFGAVTSAVARVAAEVPPEFIWAKKGGGGQNDEGRCISLDAAGNIYIAGYFGTNAAFGSLILTAASNSNLFLAKYAPDGALLWAQKATANGAVIPNSLAVDSQTNVWITGAFVGTAAFGSISLTNGSFSSSDMFLAKYDSGGDILWARQAGGAWADQGNSVAVDQLGNGYVTGSFASSTTSFGSLILTNTSNSATTSDIFIAKYDAAGQVLWAQKAGGSANDQGNGIAVSVNGDVCLTGFFVNTASFRGLTLSFTNTITQVMFIAKYDSAGNPLWVSTGAGTFSGIGQQVAIDRLGNIYATAYKISYFNSDLLMKFAPDGSLLWYRQAVPVGGYISGNGLALDALGNPCVAGEAYGFGYIGQFSVAGGYVAKYGSDGALLWVLRAGSNARGVAVDLSARVFAVGQFGGTSAFGTTTLTSSGGSSDVFLGQLGVRPPSVANQRVVRTRAYGSNVTMNVIATGFGLGYQWQFNGNDIAGATSATLTVSNLQFANAGVYSVVVKNTAAATSSVAAIVNVIPVLNYNLSSNLLQLSWPDSGYALQFSTNAAGPFVTLSNSSPHAVSLGGAPKGFYRLYSDAHGVLTTPMFALDGRFLLNLAGTLGMNYVIEASADLVSWKSVYTNVPPFLFSDPNTTSYPQRFYRPVLVR